MKLFLALPVYGGYHPHFTGALMQYLTHRHRPYGLMVRPLVGDSAVGRARNRLAAQFLASDCTHLLFLDTDLVFGPADIQRLVDHPEPIVAGLYPKKQPSLAWVCNMLDPSPAPRPDGLQEVKYAGTGCLRIAREVFESMADAYPELEYQPDDGEQFDGRMWDFFTMGVWRCPETGRRRYLTEDWWFCQRARDMGYPIWMDTQIVLKHCGDAVYPLQPVETFATVAP